MAKADGGKSPAGAAIGTALKAGGLRAALGLSVSKAQKDNQSMLSAMVSRLAHAVPFLANAMANGKASKNAVANLMEIAKTMEVIIRNHTQTRQRLQREAKQKLDIKTPAPTNPAAATPQPRRAPQQRLAPIFAPAPKPPE